MAYGHSWWQPAAISKKEWARIRVGVSMVIEAAVAEKHGIKHFPEPVSEEMAFRFCSSNAAWQWFTVVRTADAVLYPDGFGASDISSSGAGLFRCETNLYAFDTIVCASLLVCAHVLGPSRFRLSSDGKWDSPAWKAARDFYRRATGIEFEGSPLVSGADFAL